ncbi:potassium channel family protein [Rhodococcus sp. SMB37]|uniref:potassium channel family protein n=1 Tax=Rhodococcus sp. SMB37 TaxID=2512213 RepID=UPI0006D08AAD|nr:potassium channel family protein [Rhodococcus sp. SMB37]
MPNRARSSDADRSAQLRGLTWRALLRTVTTLGVVGVAYFTLPFTELDDLPALVLLVCGSAVVCAVCGWQVWWVLRSPHPVAQAMEGIAATATVYIFGFASLYAVLSQVEPQGFTEVLTRMGALYFGLTVFATVGFGDIAAVTDGTRAVVSAQIVCNLIFLALVVRLFMLTAKHRRQQVGEDPIPGEGP